MDHHHPWRSHHLHWQAGLPHKRLFMLRRFGILFGGLALFFLIALALIASLFIGPFHQTPPHPLALGLLLCGLPLLLFLLLGLVGSWTFRSLGRPMADVMAAADAVANGDLSVRVREQYPGEIGRLARSFNSMTAELQRAEQARRNLTADVAHELRTPLHIIQGNLEGILDGVYQPDPEVIEATLEETRLLARLVSDLQTLSLAEAGQLPLHKVRISAADLLEDAAASFRGQAAEAGISLEVALTGDPAGLEIDVDPDRIGQVLNNLIANALRHTPAGGWIRLKAAPLEGGVRLSVQDSGAGIPAADLPYVFDRFWKGDRARLRQEGAGSGLGLAIARQLVRAHGGVIEVTSQVGQGTLFTIDLFS